jgi:hypothetical protein
LAAVFEALLVSALPVTPEVECIIRERLETFDEDAKVARPWEDVLADLKARRPLPGAADLTLNISEADNSLDLDLVRSVAPFFRLKTKAADEIIKSSQAVVQWPKIARRLALSARACDHMAPTLPAENLTAVRHVANGRDPPRVYAAA